MSTAVGWQALEQEQIDEPNQMEENSEGTIGWHEKKKIEIESCPIVEENSEADVEEASDVHQSTPKAARRARTILRVFAVIRLFITIAATAMVLHFDRFKSYCMSGSNGGFRNRGPELEAIEKRLDALISDNGAASELFRFHRALFINGINILVTVLLLTGVFGKKKNCLPIYAILETAFYCYVIYFTIERHSLASFWNELSHNNVAAVVNSVFLLILIAFCLLFVPLVLRPYYKHLDSKDQSRESIIELPEDVKKPRNILRVFTTVRLLITFIVTFLIMHWNNVGMICWSYMEFGFLNGDKPLETILERLDTLAEEKVEASQFMRFHTALVLDSINFLIVGLLWAGVFARKKNCLPIYAILEIALRCFLIHARFQVKNPTCWLELIVLVVYCAIFIPKILYKYYKYLESRERAMKIQRK